MRNLFNVAAVLAIIGLSGIAQETHDFSHDAVTRPFTLSSVFPGSCIVGQFLVRSDQPPGNLYTCGGGNAWVSVVATGSVRSSDNETPAGTIDGSNTAFTLASTPSGGLQVARNGLLQSNGGDFTITGNTITFSALATPQPGDVLTAWYRY